MLYGLSRGEGTAMKIYYHPASTTSRPVMMFVAESGIQADMQVVDLFTGEHYKDPFTKVNPSRLVPVLEDGDFRLTESSAILKYLADTVNSPAYPRDLKARARVNERMDWFNTQLCRDFAYGFVYPQIFPGHKRPGDAVQAAQLAWGGERARGWFKVLDADLIGPRNGYVCGDQITIADYFGAEFAALGEALRSDFAAYPNVRRWLGNMKKLKSWAKVHEVINGFAASLKDAKLEAV
jgi:glutathione S-transferase